MYGEVVGPITSTMMDGHVVALDSESILSGLLKSGPSFSIDAIGEWYQRQDA